MLENTRKVYQLVLDTEKEFNDEKMELLKRREAIQKQINNILPFASAAMKRESRYEVEEIDFSLVALEQNKNKAILNLALLPQLKQAFEDDEKSWKSSADKKIEDLLAQLESELMLLIKQSSEENNAYMDIQRDMICYLKKTMQSAGYDIGDKGVDLEVWKGVKSTYPLFQINQTFRRMISAIERSENPLFLAEAQFNEYNIQTQSTEEERKKEIEEKGSYFINEGNFVIVDNAKYNEWWDRENGDNNNKK